MDFVSGAKRSLIFVVIDRFRFYRSTFETAGKIGSSTPGFFGFVIR